MCVHRIMRFIGVRQLKKETARCNVPIDWGTLVYVDV